MYKVTFECVNCRKSVVTTVQHKIEKETIEHCGAACSDCNSKAQAFYSSEYYKEFEASEAENF